MKRMVQWLLAVALAAPISAVIADEPAAKEGDKPAKTSIDKKKVRRPTPEQTEAEMAFFGLPDSIHLTFDQRVKLHEISEDVAPGIEADAARLAALNAANRQYVGYNRPRKGQPAQMPGYKSEAGKLQKELSGAQKEARDKVLALLTPKQRVKIDPSLKDFKAEEKKPEGKKK
jgi:hypothetical protein